MAKADNKVNPMRITDPDTGEVYVLEYSRESVRFAEQRGFKITELTDFPQTNIPALFFYAFRKNHRSLPRDKTDKHHEDHGGLTAAEITRHEEHYNKPNEMFPYYLSLGMTADQFWDDDPWLAAAYRKANEIRTQRLSEEMWLQGLYNYHAFAVAVSNVMRSKGTKPQKYLEEPLRLIPLTEEEKNEKAEKERKRLIEYLNRMKKSEP